MAGTARHARNATTGQQLFGGLAVLMRGLSAWRAGGERSAYAAYGSTMVWRRWAVASTFCGNRGPAT
jgi:hypothetical protein